MIKKENIIENVKNKGIIVEKFLGYTNRAVPPIIKKKIEKEMEIFEKYIEIEYEYKIFNDCENEYKNIYGNVIYTIGSKLDEVVKEYTNNSEGMRAMILDKIGVVVLDEIRDAIKIEIFEKYGYKVKKEIYPGGIKTPLIMQKEILESMDNIKTININEYYQLNPLKSVALKFLFSEKDEYYNRCEECQNPCEMYENEEEKRYDYLKNKAENYTKELYKSENISDEVYVDNIKDLEIWANNYKNKIGIKGIEKRHFKWIDDILEMKVIKLGRLQFELLNIDNEEKIVKDLMKQYEGDILVNVHIREKDKFSYDECENSYLEAKKYYENKGIKFNKIIFICYSWLLNPNLKNILPENSNILNFQKRYKTLYINENEEEPQIIERVYGDSKVQVENFLENTKLQINLKKAWENGQRFPMTKGYFEY